MRGFSISGGGDLLQQPLPDPESMSQAFSDPGAIRSGGGFWALFASLSSMSATSVLFGPSAVTLVPGSRAAVLLPAMSQSWGFDNGLSAGVAKTLSLSLLFGGAVYPGAFSTLPPSALMIGWLRTCVMLPLQFRVLPWRYATSEESATVLEEYGNTLSLRLTLHQFLVDALGEARLTGYPVVRPLWLSQSRKYLSPSEQSDILLVEDQYMIGSSLVLAPQLSTGGGGSRMFLLPSGYWRSCEDIRNSSATVYGAGWTTYNLTVTGTVPCFIRADYPRFD